MIRKVYTTIWELLHLIPKALERLLVMPFKKAMLGACGKAVILGKGANFTWGNVYIGDNVNIGPNAMFMCTRAKITIGNHVIFGPNATLITGDHRIDVIGRYIDSIKDSEKVPDNDKEIMIMGDSWIGANVTILKGVTISEGSLIAAGSVVTRDVEPYSIYAGVPAKKIKDRFTEKQIDEHKKILLKV